MDNEVKIGQPSKKVKNRESQQELESIERTDQLLLQTLRGTDEVVVIGPNKSITEDPTLIFASYVMAKAGSVKKLWVVDPCWEWRELGTQVQRDSGSVLLG